MNQTISTKYGVAPETVKKKSLDSENGEYFRELYDFLRLKKVENNQSRNDKYDTKLDKRKRTLRSPLYLDEKVLVLAERLKKKTHPASFIKLQQTIRLFLIETKFSLSIKEQN